MERDILNDLMLDKAKLFDIINCLCVSYTCVCVCTTEIV